MSISIDNAFVKQFESEVFDTIHAPVVFNAVESLSAIWTVALSVLGLYVYKRSDEKRAITIVQPPVEKAVPAKVATATHFNN